MGVSVCIGLVWLGLGHQQTDLLTLNRATTTTAKRRRVCVSVAVCAKQKRDLETKIYFLKKQRFEKPWLGVCEWVHNCLNSD